MLPYNKRINRYGAKFFIGNLVRVIRDDEYLQEDKGKVGVVDGIAGDVESGFSYSLTPTETNKVAWFDEGDIDFVYDADRREYEENYNKFKKELKK